MKELKKGDFTGIYSSIDGKPLYFTGVYSCMEYDGMPCVFLATDLHNNLTFCRWSQQDLNKRGFTIAPRPVEISKTAMQMIRKAGAVIRWTTAAERKAANTDHKRMSAYIITTAAGDFYTTGTCADVREILKAAQAAPLPEESTPESCQKSPQEENMRRFTIYTDSDMAGIDSRGAYTTLAEARMRLEKELDEDETSRGGYIFDELRQKVTAIYNGFNLEKIPEPYRGTPNEYTTKKERAMLESIMNKYSSEPTPATEANQDTTTGAQEGPTTAGTTAANETPTAAETAPQDATTGPKTSTATQDTTGSDTKPPRATEDATTGHAANNTSTPATAAGDTSTPANQEPGTAAKSRNNATPCDNTRHHATPGHACEIAPGRTKRRKAEHVPIAAAKSPPRAKTRAGRRTIRGRPDRRKGTFSGGMSKRVHIYRSILGVPIFNQDF